MKKKIKKKCDHGQRYSKACQENRFIKLFYSHLHLLKELQQVSSGIIPLYLKYTYLKDY